VYCPSLYFMAGICPPPTPSCYTPPAPILPVSEADIRPLMLTWRQLTILGTYESKGSRKSLTSRPFGPFRPGARWTAYKLMRGSVGTFIPTHTTPSVLICLGFPSSTFLSLLFYMSDSSGISIRCVSALQIIVGRIQGNCVAVMFLSVA
jgi:hypothetical protein